MKKFVITILFCLFLINTAIADEIGIGGSWPVKGHSESGDYGVNNGDKDSYAITAYYDFETNLRYRFLGIDPGFSYTLIRWWRQDNKKDEDEELIDSHIFTLHIRPFVEISDEFRIFALGGIGYEEAINDSSDDLTVSYGIGSQYYFSDKFSLSLSYQKIYNNPRGNYRRYGMDFVITANFRF